MTDLLLKKMKVPADKPIKDYDAVDRAIIRANAGKLSTICRGRMVNDPATKLIEQRTRYMHVNGRFVPFTENIYG